MTNEELRVNALVRAMRSGGIPRTAEGDVDYAAMGAPPVTPEEEAEIERQRAEDEERQERERRSAGRRQVLQALRGVPLRDEIKMAIVDGSIGATKAIDATRRWQSGSKPILLLLGGVGCGKTVAGAYAMARALEAGRDAAYAKMRDVAHLYRAGFGDDAKAFEGLLRVSLLVVDELTTERDPELGRAALNEVVDERGSRGRPTMLLANRTKAEIRERYDARTIDRLREGAVVVELADKSLRRGQW